LPLYLIFTWDFTRASLRRKEDLRLAQCTGNLKLPGWRCQLKKEEITMVKERISVDEVLSDQLKTSFSATVEAIEGKPDLVKITPWTAASGCLCRLSMNINKSSLEGVSPTGDTHVCCGKTLKVVELHFRKGESIALEDVLGQLNTSANKAASWQDPVQVEPMEAAGQPAQPIPPPWGWNPPWLADFFRHPVHRTPLSAGFSRTAMCEPNYSRCTENCRYSSNPIQCNCLCRSSYLMCMGHPGYEC
jgi:hypothetical protein